MRFTLSHFESVSRRFKFHVFLKEMAISIFSYSEAGNEIVLRVKKEIHHLFESKEETWKLLLIKMIYHCYVKAQ